MMTAGDRERIGRDQEGVKECKTAFYILNISW